MRCRGQCPSSYRDYLRFCYSILGNTVGRCTYAETLAPRCSQDHSSGPSTFPLARRINKPRFWICGPPSARFDGLQRRRHQNWPPLALGDVQIVCAPQCAADHRGEAPDARVRPLGRAGRFKRTTSPPPGAHTRSCPTQSRLPPPSAFREAVALEAQARAGGEGGAFANPCANPLQTFATPYDFLANPLGGCLWEFENHRKT